MIEFLHPLLCSLAGFAALCLAMERHHQDALGHAPSPAWRRGLRVLALLAFALSWLTVWTRPDAGIAWAEWGAQLTLAALAVVALATWWPLWLAPALLLSLSAAAMLLGLGV
ncbi:DUF3325 domain-containing protein [Paucibacter sp. PLA-PC-4]|uniref:DUF3325 domain-containing protein n=1 Tax=Paucibacter sp. PLA-PC-4 TaxID=2993655 RepID=UPI0022492A5B|nr:DUF3325 domain-containing protein [Paucibacter sp. PLA-PC-4]MCX2863247.1 DUF3325 domain-containing protein [Paucibacter sp. PLA-PC-4]